MIKGQYFWELRAVRLCIGAFEEPKIIIPVDLVDRGLRPDAAGFFQQRRPASSFRKTGASLCVPQFACVMVDSASELYASR